MTCITGQLKDVPCILCEGADQVYMGHGKARFCARCSITWDPSEDGIEINAKSVVFDDDAVDGVLPEDIVSRMGLLAGRVLDVLDFNRRLSDVLAIPEALFIEDANMKYAGQPRDSHGRFASTGGSGGGKKRKRKRRKKDREKVAPPVAMVSPRPPITGEGISGGRVDPENRVWQGQKYAKPEKTLTRLQTGELGERVAMKAFQDKYGVPFEEMNVGRNNAPIDVKGDHIALEVKGGSGHIGEKSRAWRSMEGERGKAEKARISQMSKKEREIYANGKRAKILERKAAEVERLTQEAGGQRFNPKMAGVIFTPDGRHADVFEVDGHHLYLGWGKHATSENYVGTYSVGDDVWNEVMSKAVIMKAMDRVENPLDQLMVEGYLYEEDLGSFTPEMIELLSYEWIYLDVVGLEWLEMHGYLEALVEANADPKTMTQAESDAIWNTLFPDQAVEVDVTYLYAEKTAEIEDLEGRWNNES